jgi:MFS family permease
MEMESEGRRTQPSILRYVLVGAVSFGISNFMGFLFGPGLLFSFAYLYGFPLDYKIGGIVGFTIWGAILGFFGVMGLLLAVLPEIKGGDLLLLTGTVGFAIGGMVGSAVGFTLGNFGDAVPTFIMCLIWGAFGGISLGVLSKDVKRICIMILWVIIGFAIGSIFLTPLSVALLLWGVIFGAMFGIGIYQTKIGLHDIEFHMSKRAKFITFAVIMVAALAITVFAIFPQENPEIACLAAGGNWSDNLCVCYNGSECPGGQVCILPLLDDKGLISWEYDGGPGHCGTLGHYGCWKWIDKEGNLRVVCAD